MYFNINLLIRYSGLSAKETDIAWIKHDNIFYGKRHPAEMDAIEVSGNCLTWSMYIVFHRYPVLGYKFS